MSPHKPRRFSADGDFVNRLEGPERRKLVPQDEVVRFLRLSRKETLLDLGAGIGYFSLPASRRSGTVIALDMEPKMLEVLSNRKAQKGITNLELARADIGALPIPDASVGHVLAAFVYHEVASPTKFIRECARVLPPGGHLTIVDFQKRETPIGPPVEERKTPRDVLRTTSKEFKLESRIETGVYYALKLRRL